MKSKKLHATAAKVARTMPGSAVRILCRIFNVEDNYFVHDMA